MAASHDAAARSSDIEPASAHACGRILGAVSCGSGGCIATAESLEVIDASGPVLAHVDAHWMNCRVFSMSDRTLVLARAIESTTSAGANTKLKCFVLECS